MQRRFARNCALSLGATGGRPDGGKRSERKNRAVRKPIKQSAVQRLRRRPCWPELRLVLLLGIYSVVQVGCRWLAYQLRFDFAVPAASQELVFQRWMWVLCAQIIFLAGFRQFSGVTRYFSLPDVKYLMLAIVSSALFLGLLRYSQSEFYSPPRGVILIDSMLCFGALGALRLGYRLVHERRWSDCDRAPGPLHNVAIVGAGDVGSSLVLELNHRPGLGLKPVVDRKR